MKNTVSAAIVAIVTALTIVSFTACSADNGMADQGSDGFIGSDSGNIMSDIDSTVSKVASDVDSNVDSTMSNIESNLDTSSK